MENDVPDKCGCGGHFELVYIKQGEEIWQCSGCDEEWRRYCDSIGG